MRTLIRTLCLIFMVTCYGQSEETKLNVKISNDNYSVNESDKKVPKDSAFQININFVDNPVWLWVKYDHQFEKEEKVFDHIYGINYWDENGNVTTLYYERDRELANLTEFEFEDYIIQPYPGDKTLKLIGKKSDTIYLFNVLENKSLNRNFRDMEFLRIPTVDFNNKNEKVSGYDIEVNVKNLGNSMFQVIFIDNNGYEKHLFKSKCTFKEAIEISYYDLTNNRIYLIEKECFLEKIN